MHASIYDFIAIGVGPFNLSLACLTEPIEGLNGLFLDRNSRFNWHPGMMLESSTLQTPFLGDLVTLADPTSPYSFLSYIKSQGRIYSFYIKEDFFLLRNEYNRYCDWVARQLPNILFDRNVTRVTFDENSRLYTVQGLCTKTGALFSHQTRRIVLGTGTSPMVPECCRDVAGQVTHTASYIQDKPSLQTKTSITIVGSGQSAAEIYHDLLQDIDRFGYRLNWVTRSPRFFPLELTKLTLEMTSPDYTDYFHGLPQHRRDRLIDEQKNLYKGINATLINDIYDLLYKKKLIADIDTWLMTNIELRNCHYDEKKRLFVLDLHQKEQQANCIVETEGLVLATGYAYRLPDFLAPISDRIRWDTKGRFAVNRNYSVDMSGSEIFVQNAELHTHGFVAPDLGMACYRNSCIIRELLGRDYYPIERDTVFQHFAVHARPSTSTARARPDAA
ncbi:alcaligin biosynthesis protein [Phyllobacterium phragmitis]|uniref:Alcaligin biosynthesis protein n=1 Tax=Phyllobacterium phragmitis TaxID=2670329 RepID=A0A2S9IKI1_9HYPH|nr:SidA/IucD/PvdA family monooxygenase [Phyllobacterium phragmitis]PRD41041.1 alcaligin biosynthesis protein [Phyllobacterium phragmitis]